MSVRDIAVASTVPHARRVPETWLVLVAFGVALLAGLLTLLVHDLPDELGAFRPTMGILVGAFLATDTRHWPYIGVLAFIVGIPLAYGDAFFDHSIINAAEVLASIIAAAIGCHTVRRGHNQRLSMNRLTPDTRDFVLMVIAVATITGALDSVFQNLRGQGPLALYQWPVQIVPIAASIFVFALPILALTSRTPNYRSLKNQRAIAELAAIFIVFMMLAGVLFHTSTRDVSQYILVDVSCWILLLWTAIRFDVRVVTALVVVFATVVAIALIEGAGPWVGLSDDTFIRAYAGYANLSGIVLVGVVLSARIARMTNLKEERAADEQNIANVLDLVGAAVWVFNVRISDFELYRYPDGDDWADMGLFPEDHERWFREVLHPDDVDSIQPLFHRMQSGDFREPVRASFRVKISESETRWRKIRGFPILDSEGALHKYVGTISDITYEKTLRTKQRQLREILFESEKQQTIGALGAGLAHDLKNLLLIMSMEIENLRGHVKSSPEFAESIDALDKVIDEAQDMSDELATLRRRDPGPMLSCELGDEIRKAIGPLKRAVPPGVTLDVTSVIPAGVCVLARPSHLHLLVLNLGLNARDALGLSGGHLGIDLSGPETHSLNGQETEVAIIRVSDDGCGMAEETLEQAFDPLFSTKPCGNVGLGLSVVRSVVEEMDGSMVVDSECGRGTDVTVYLPLTGSD